MFATLQSPHNMNCLRREEVFRHYVCLMISNLRIHPCSFVSSNSTVLYGILLDSDDPSIRAKIIRNEEKTHSSNKFISLEVNQ